jgi:transposase-like protein
MKDKALKERIVAEYLTSGKSYREVAKKCGVAYRSLHRWVKEYQGRMKKPHQYRRARLLRELPTDKLPTDVTILQSELRKARLYNQALQQVIRLAEEELGIPILKKSGTKQS